MLSPRPLKGPAVHFPSCVLFLRSSRQAAHLNNSALYCLGTSFTTALVTFICLLNRIHSFVTSPLPPKLHTKIPLLISNSSLQRQAKHQCHAGGLSVSSAPQFSSSSLAAASLALGAPASTVAATTTTSATATLANGTEELLVLSSAPY